MDVTNQIDKIRSFIDRQIHIDFISKEEKVIYYLLSLSIFYDFINGIWLYKVTKTGISISQVIRLCILALFLYYLLKYSFSKIYILLPIGIFFALNIWLAYHSNLSLDGLKYDLIMASKYIYFLILTMSIISLYKHQRITGYIIKRIIYNNAFLFPILFFISYLIGVGQSSYNDAGLKGAFYSMNGINAALIVFLIFAIDILYREKDKIKGILFVVYIMIPLLLLGSKSSFLFTIFVFLMYIFLNIHERRKTITFAILSIIAIICLTLFVAIGFNSSLLKILHRQLQLIYFYNNSFISYFLSGRNELLSVEAHIFKVTFNIKRLIIGVGTFAEQKELAWSIRSIIKTVGLKNIEMDLFDIFFAYGIIGVIIIYGYVIKVFAENIQKLRLLEKQPYVISIICLFIFSVLGGHIFGEPTASTFLGITLCGLYIDNANINVRSCNNN